MGSGGIKASKRQATAEKPRHASADHRGRLGPVLLAAAREPKGATTAELGAALRCLASAAPAEASAWFSQRLDVSPKSGAALASLLHRLIGCVLDPKVAAAEDAAAQVEGRSDGVADVGRLVDACESSLAVEDPVERDAVAVATVVLDRVFAKSSWQGDCTVLSFDRLVRIFHRSFIAHMQGSSRNLQRWREMREGAGLPAIEEHCRLLSPASRGALLALRLVPEDSTPVQVVLSRESALTDFSQQLPDLAQPCVLQPYFESASGTKVIRGRRVEGGEGHGPRKEFFVGVSADACRRWGPPVAAPAPSPAAPPEAAPVAGATCSGSRIALADPSALEGASREVRICLEGARAGDRLTLRLAGGGEAERTLAAVLDPATLIVDGPLEGAPPVAVLGCEVRKPCRPIFEYHRATGGQWFAAHAQDLSGARGEELRARCVAFGKLLALAVVNHCRFSLALPVIFFRLLLHGVTPGLPSLPPEFSAGLEDLRGFDDVLQKSLRKCLKMKAAMFQQLREVEGLPDHVSPEEYVAQQVTATFMPQAMHEIRRGFWAMTSLEQLCGVSAEDLHHWICPVACNSQISLRNVFHIVMEEEMSEVPAFVAAFNAILDGLTDAETRLFLTFVTGVEEPPEPKTEQLTVQLPFSAFTRAEHEAMLGMLPQAHTCSNTLELPNYHEALVETGEVARGDEAAMRKALQRVLGERLRVAIREAGGYELDAVASVPGRGEHGQPPSSEGGAPPTSARSPRPPPQSGPAPASPPPARPSGGAPPAEAPEARAAPPAGPRPAAADAESAAGAEGAAGDGGAAGPARSAGGQAAAEAAAARGGGSQQEPRGHAEGAAPAADDGPRAPGAPHGKEHDVDSLLQELELSLA